MSQATTARQAIVALAIALLLAALQGCGQTGPLYLPSEEPGASARDPNDPVVATEAATEITGDNAGGITVPAATDTD